MRFLVILSAFALAFGTSSCATMMGAQATPEMRTYQRIVEFPGMKKADIYIKANAWFVETFNSAESVIEFQDKEAGKIMGKYVFSYAEGVYTYSVKQTIDIAIKDGKVKVVISSPMYKATSGMGERYNNPYRNLTTQAGVQRARTEWAKLTSQLETYLKSDNSDW